MMCHVPSIRYVADVASWYGNTTLDFVSKLVLWLFQAHHQPCDSFSPTHLEHPRRGFTWGCVLLASRHGEVRLEGNGLMVMIHHQGHRHLSISRRLVGLDVCFRLVLKMLAVRDTLKPIYRQARR